jgi:hypothetical protein
MDFKNHEKKISEPKVLRLFQIFVISNKKNPEAD